MVTTIFKKKPTLTKFGIFITIFLIVAIFTLPKFEEINLKTKTSKLKGHLGIMRTAIATEYARRAINGISPLYPHTITKELFSNQKLPIEPFSKTQKITTLDTPITSKTIQNTGGWIYSKVNGEIRANYSDFRGQY